MICKRAKLISSMTLSMWVSSMVRVCLVHSAELAWKGDCTHERAGRISQGCAHLGAHSFSSGSLCVPTYCWTGHADVKFSVGLAAGIHTVKGQWSNVSSRCWRKQKSIDFPLRCTLQSYRSHEDGRKGLGHLRPILFQFILSLAEI